MTEKKKNMYQSDTLGVPPLRMVLVHTEKERRNAASQIPQRLKAYMQKAGIGQEDLIRLVEHLKKKI
jgi:hypothetical protein